MVKDVQLASESKYFPASQKVQVASEAGAVSEGHTPSAHPVGRVQPEKKNIKKKRKRLKFPNKESSDWICKKKKKKDVQKPRVFLFRGELE